jgi:arylsulfotransferase ASST
MAETAPSFPAPRHWPSGLGRARRVAAVVVAALTVLAVTACTGSPAGPGAASQGAPPLKVLVPGAGSGNDDIFVAPQAGGGYRDGPEILSGSGQVVWFHALPAGETADDFRTQSYQGRPVLTWFQGMGLDGTDYIYNDRYQQIATVKAGNGYFTDFHEFLITPWNTALILADTYGTANLTSIGGPADQKVFDGIVQEIDIPTGRVLFEWDSADHVPYSDSHEPRPASAASPWDWFHINAVHLDTDGNLLINSRYTWTTYKVNLHTGRTIWELGGRQSSFTLVAAPGQVLDAAREIFAFQHDPEAVGDGEYTFFDDESDGSTRLLSHSRVVTVRLDLATMVATLVKSVDQPEGLVAQAEGNAQTTPNGDLVVGWGSLPYISEFSPSGRLLFNAEFASEANTYRAYRLPWHPAGGALLPLDAPESSLSRP